jgi:hypothetical protein
MRCQTLSFDTIARVWLGWLQQEEGAPVQTIKTNKDILTLLRYHRITVTELADAMGENRSVLSMRLNTRDRPDPDFLASVKAKIEELKR